MKKIRRIVTATVFALYIFLLIHVLFFRYGRSAAAGIDGLSYRLKYAANFVPFKTIRSYAAAMHRIPRVAVLNVIGNLALFAPMGILLPSAVPAMRRPMRTLLFVFVLIVAVECVQLLLGLGSFDVDDIILNFTGCAVCCAVYFSIASRRSGKA